MNSPSALALIAANLVPLVAVLAWNWPALPLVALYTLETVIVVVLAVARFILSDPQSIVWWLAKVVFVPLYCLYAIFLLMFALMPLSLLALFGEEEIRKFAFAIVLDVVEFLPASEFGAKLLRTLPADISFADADRYRIGVPLAVLCASHLFSFLWNYLLRGECFFGEQGSRRAMSVCFVRPFARIYMTLAAVLAGGSLALWLESPLWAILLLIAGKTALDLWAHLREHRPA